ncbi:hypothetical protein PV08_03737 [Exophiala spinifera]|uniref:Aspartate racemase n=1 Tax=Exophiala spinifera TaxID=91928 RepID=A0A0D2BZ32_9EURO|nr:uncharacterized protein PV08_03737 [Exophiala spinifera]KIW16549.1 hypothetical protein PV08_03737 [Exophiala spinifera]
MTKTVGLIGGFSWQSTSVYYKEINEHVNARQGGLHSANLLIRSIDYAELAAMVSQKDYNGMTRMLCKHGQELKDANAQALVLCANIAHKAAESLEQSSGLPVLHIVDFTAQKINTFGFKKVGLLATRAVMEEDFYKARLQGFGLEIAIPSEEFRSTADNDIFVEMSKGTIPQDVRSRWHEAYRLLFHEQGVDCVILACTELRLVFVPVDLSGPTFETTTIHAGGIAEWALA